MKKLMMFGAALLLAPAAICAPNSSTLATSKEPHSTVSLIVEPKLDDGRLVLKVAAQNGSATPVPFGPGSISINKPNGEAIRLRPLPQLIQDVRVASGAPSSAPSGGGYAIRPQGVDASGKMDVNGYTGGAGIAPDEMRNVSKQSIDRRAAESQIAALKQAILRDGIVQPGKVTAGEVVSEKLKFKEGEDRTIHVLIGIAGDTHGFTIAAPKN